jgi:phage terminase small subunit
MPRGSKDAPLSRLREGKEKQFALFLSEGKSQATAARLAGYSIHRKQDYERVAARPTVRAAVQHLQKRYEDSIVASRRMVLEGFLEAIEQAKLQADPAVQISGWREIGKMCGYYAPEVKEVNVTVGAKRVIGQLEVLSDAELLEMIEKDREALIGEAHEVLDTPPEELSGQHDSEG